MLKNVRDAGNIFHFGIVLHTDQVASYTLTMVSGVGRGLFIGRHVVTVVVVIVTPITLTR